MGNHRTLTLSQCTVVLGSLWRPFLLLKPLTFRVKYEIIDILNPHNGHSFWRSEPNKELHGTGKYVKNTYGWQTDDINEAHTYQTEKGAKQAADELTKDGANNITWDIKVPEDESARYIVREVQLVIV